MKFLLYLNHDLNQEQFPVCCSIHESQISQVNIALKVIPGYLFGFIKMSRLMVTLAF